MSSFTPRDSFQLHEAIESVRNVMILISELMDRIRHGCNEYKYDSFDPVALTHFLLYVLRVYYALPYDRDANSTTYITEVADTEIRLNRDSELLSVTEIRMGGHTWPTEPT